MISNEELIDQLENARETIANLKKHGDRSREGVEFSELVKQRDEAIRKLVDARRSADEWHGKYVKTNSELDQLKGHFDDFVESFQKLKAAVGDITRQRDVLNARVTRLNKQWRVAMGTMRAEERERYNEQFDEFCDELQAKSEAKDLARQHEVAKLTKQLTGAKERIVDLQERLDVLKLASARRTAELLAASEFI